MKSDLNKDEDEKEDVIHAETENVLKKIQEQLNLSKDVLNKTDFRRSQSFINPSFNLNQNIISDLIPEGKKGENDKIMESFKKSMEHILLDYNMFKKEDYTKIMVDLETLELKDIDAKSRLKL